MAKNKPKIITFVIKQNRAPNKAAKKGWLGRYFLKAAMVIAGTIGTSYCIDNYIEFNAARQQPTIEVVIPTPRPVPLRERWNEGYNPEGIHMDTTFLDNYDILRQRRKLESMADKSPEAKSDLERLLETSKASYEDFCKDPTPENYTPETFSCFWGMAAYDWRFIRPNEVMNIFEIMHNPLYQQLEDMKEDDDSERVKQILACATLITQSHLEYKATDDSTLEQYLANLESGVGDCSEYCYSTASTYYAICNALGRKDLFSNIRTTLGVEIKDDYRVNQAHAWIDYNDHGIWLRTDPHMDDRTSTNNPTSHKTITTTDANSLALELGGTALKYARNGETIFYTPLVSTTLEQTPDGRFRPEFYAHQLPK